MRGLLKLSLEQMIQYLNLPKINIAGIRNNLVSTSYNSVIKGYTAYDIDPDCNIYASISALFPERFFKEIYKKTLQVMEPEWNGYIHQDPRDYAINYILDTGDKDVTTSFYDSDKNITSCNIIPFYTWHIIHTKTFHAIDNVKTKRAAISLSLTEPSAELLEWIRSITVNNT